MITNQSYLNPQIFDRDFNTYVHMDSDTQIEHLSRVLIRPKTADGHHKDGHQKSAVHHKTPHQSTRSERNQSESIVVSVNPSDLNNQQSNSSSISQINQLIGQLGAQVGSQTVNQSTSQLNNPTSSQTSSQTNSHLINQLNSQTNGHQRNSQMQFDLFNLPKSQSSSLTLKSDPIASLNSLAAGSVASTSNLMTNASAYLQADQSETFEDEASNGQSFENGGNIDIEWPEDDVAALIECCQQFAQNFTYYNVSIDLVYLDQQTDDELWEQIAAKVRRCTSKSYKKAQCRSKFLELRTKYINVKAYTGLENSYFCQQKYFHNLEQLIDGVKPSVDLLQLNGQLKARHREHGKNGFKDKNSYLSLIAQVKAFARQFNENIVSKNSIWKEIANNLNQEGFRFTGKSCQGLFHRLRYSYLHLLKTIASEEEGQEKWPYFQAFSVGFV